MNRILYISSGKKTLSDLTPSLTHAFLHLEKERDDFQFLAHSVLNETLQSLTKKITEFQPTMIVIFGQDTHEALQYVKHVKVPIGLWVVNDPYRMADYIHKAQQYDFIITEESSCVPFYKKELNIQSFHFPLAVNEKNYYPIPKLKKIYDFSFIGNATRSRIAFFNTLLKKTNYDHFLIVGRGWNNLSQFKKYKKQIKLKLITPKEVCHIYNQSKIVLNLHRSSDDQKKNPYQLQALTPNNRTFDICATNSFQLVSSRENLNDYYELNKEIVAFDNVNDLARKMEQYRKNDKLRETIAKNGYLRTLQDHTYKVRVASLLDTLPIELKVIRTFK